MKLSTQECLAILPFSSPTACCPIQPHLSLPAPLSPTKRAPFLFPFFRQKPKSTACYLWLGIYTSPPPSSSTPVGPFLPQPRGFLRQRGRVTPLSEHRVLSSSASGVRTSSSVWPPKASWPGPAFPDLHASHTHLPLLLLACPFELFQLPAKHWLKTASSMKPSLLSPLLDGGNSPPTATPLEHPCVGAPSTHLSPSLTLGGSEGVPSVSVSPSPAHRAWLPEASQASLLNKE